MSLWRRTDQQLPTPRVVALAVLVTPPLGAVATEWLPNAGRAGPTAVAVAAGVGLTNAVAEDALWRGVPVTVFPDDPVRGWLWPAVGFTAWHLVPLTVRPTSPRRRIGVVAGAALIGLGQGWIAQRTGSLAVVSPAHVLTDACGVRPAESIWLGRDG
jgi:membrane protease YdiL (CAAX protease family)